MKNIILILLMFNLSISNANVQLNYQDEEILYSDIDKYRKAEIKAEFNDVFKSEDDRNNFKQLREFKKEKEDLLDALRYNLSKFYDRSQDIKFVEDKISKLRGLVEGKNLNDEILVARDLLDYGDDYYDIIYSNKGFQYFGNDSLMNIKGINSSILSLEKRKVKLTNENDTRNFLNANIKNVKQDIYQCLKQIDAALAPEYAQQDFRKQISIYFTGLIGILLVVFFFIVYKKSDHNLSKELLSGYGLQFVTLFVLIIAVILFGILGILQGSELAAILAGISGYILGKGVPTTSKDNTNVIVNDQ